MTSRSIVARVLGGVCCWAAAAAGQEPDWGSMGYTRHADFQAVDGNGAGTFATTAAIRMRGVILNRPADMLDPTPGSNPYMGGQWQFFLQSTEPDDRGGTALYMGQNIGKNVGNHPAGSYTDAEWLAERDRLNHDAVDGRPFRPGDLVEVRARAPGLFFRGKTNVNEQHQKDPAADFDIVLVEAAFGLPDARTIALSELKDASDQFVFDPSRLAGPERYQGTAVRLENVQFAGGTWAPNGTLTIADGTGRTFPVLLGLGRGFSRFAQPTGVIDIVGILDQEDTNSADGLKSGYRLWVMDYDGAAFVLYRFVKPDFDRNGDVDVADFDHFRDCTSGPGLPQESAECRDSDFDGDGDVDQADFAVFQRCLSGPTELPDRRCDE